MGFWVMGFWVMGFWVWGFGYGVLGYAYLIMPDIAAYSISSPYKAKWLSLINDFEFTSIFSLPLAWRRRLIG
jgi:acyl-coenzyme A synthetase/AMP-(fatty) acid ligase